MASITGLSSYNPLADSEELKNILAPGDKEKIAFDLLVKIFQPGALPIDELHPDVSSKKTEEALLGRIQDKFSKALESYRKDYEEAKKLDEARFKEIDAKLQQGINETHFARKYAFLGLLLAGIGAIPGYFIGRSWDEDVINRLKESAMREKYSYRRFWLIKVDILEKERIVQNLKDIKMIVNTLTEQISKLLPGKELAVKEAEMGKLTKILRKYS